MRIEGRCACFGLPADPLVNQAESRNCRMQFCGSVALSIEAGPATGALTRGTATHGSSNPAGCCCGISNIRVLGMWRRACIIGSCCGSSQWHSGAFISAIPENLSQRRKHCARNSCTQRRLVHGAAALKSTVGNANRNPDRFSKGRQWSGRPVRDNAVPFSFGLRHRNESGR